jgi:hypothetical protein
MKSPQQCNHHKSTATTTAQSPLSTFKQRNFQTAEQCLSCMQYPSAPMCVLQEQNNVAQLYNKTPLIHVQQIIACRHVLA